MTLTYRQERLLRRADRALTESDPDLASMLSIFAQITAAERLPAWEQLGARLTRALSVLLWPVAAVVFLAFFIADGEIRPATASGAAVRRHTLCLCLKLLGRALAVKRAPGGGQAHVEQVESQAGDPLQEPLEGALIGYLGAQRGRALAHADVTVLELRAQRGTRLACEGDLIRS